MQKMQKYSMHLFQNLTYLNISLVAILPTTQFSTMETNFLATNKKEGNSCARNLSFQEREREKKSKRLF